MQWELHHEVVCATPEIRSCQAPEKLAVGLKPFEQMDFTDEVGKHLFMPWQVKEHHDFLRAASSRRAVQAQVTNYAVGVGNAASMGGNDQPAVYIQPLWSDDQLKELQDQLRWWTNPVFYFLGEGYLYLLGFMFVLLFFKYLIGSFLRCWATARVKGLGPWMLCALWSTAFHMTFCHSCSVRCSRG